MSKLTRFGIAMPDDLLIAFDRRIEAQGYANRSEAIRDLVRADLVKETFDRGDEVAATISLVYDHHTRELTERLNAIQHEHGELIVGSFHVHMDHHHCLEVVIARGPARDLESLGSLLLGTRGVLSGGLTIAAAPPCSAEKARRHDHAHSHSHPHGHVTRSRAK